MFKKSEFDSSSTDLKIGSVYQGEGIFIGRGCFEGYDEKGQSIGQEFNFFAAKGGVIGGTRFYKKTLKVISKIRGLHGHDGAKFETEAEAVDAIRNGQWALPNHEMLISNTHLDKKRVIMPEGTLVDSHKKGLISLKSIFDVSRNRHTYWSCTKNKDSKMVYNHDIDFCGSWTLPNFEKYSSVLVRAVPRKAPQA